MSHLQTPFRKINLILLFITIIANSCSAQYTGIEMQGLYVEYPRDWVVDKLDGHIIYIHEPATKELDVRNTFDVEVDSVTKDLDSFCGEYENVMKNNVYFKNFLIIKKEAISFKGYNAFEYICKSEVSGLRIQWRFIAFEKNNVIYKLTETSLEERFKEMQKITGKIFNSFKLKE